MQRQMQRRTQGRVQTYSVLLALMMLLVATACAQLGVATWQRSGPAGAWFSIASAGVLVVGAVGLLIYAVRSIRSSIQSNRQARESRAAQASEDPPTG